jgi:hypothetical protein
LTWGTVSSTAATATATATATTVAAAAAAALGADFGDLKKKSVRCFGNYGEYKFLTPVSDGFVAETK